MTILCYHSVDDSWRSPLVVPPEHFSQHCAWLEDKRQVMDLASAVDLLDARGRLPRRSTALTFDDGFAALYEHALPLLTRHRLPATVFLVAGTLTTAGRPVDWVDDCPEPPPETLNVGQILEMQDAGVRFESHSYSHHDLPSLSESECEQDLRLSRELLEDVLGRRVSFLAYPRGRHDERVRKAAEKAGYSHAFSLPERREAVGRYAVPRAGVYPGNGVMAVRAKTARWYLPFRTSPLFPRLRVIAKGGSLNRSAS